MLRSLAGRSARAVISAVNGSVVRAHRYGPVSRAAAGQGAIYEPLESRRLMSVNVTTYHYDNARDGANTQETTLTLSNVNKNTFGKLYSFPVDGQIYTQPLIMTGVVIPGQGTHDIVLVATENDSVYAFDAHGNNPASGYLWKTSLLQTGETAVPETDYGTTDITPEIGVTGTPVIDPSTNTLYVVGLFKESNSSYTQRLYALDITTGASKFGGPVTIAGSVAGTGTGSVSGVVAFNPFRENQRPALTLANGQIYIGWASHGDQDPWHGWVMGYSAATLKQDYVYCNTPNGDAGGIWMSGGGIAVDSSGNLYFSTGNGTFDANTGGSDYGMTVQKLSPSLTVLDYFAPYNQSSLSNSDLDYGCSSVILLSNQTGADPNQIVTESKWGTMYLNDGDTGSLGEYTANGPNKDLGEANITTNTDTSNLHNTMSYWNGHVYVGGDTMTLQAFNVSGGTLATTPFTQSAHVFGNGGEDGQGCGPTISSNGSTNGIVWAVDNGGFNASPAVVYAYNASNLSQVLWTSSQAANGRDNCGDAVKFQDAVVANGQVYIAGANSVTVYGLLTASTGTPTVTTAAAASPSPVTGTTSTLTVSATDPAGDLAPNYTWAATTVPSGAATPTFQGNGGSSANSSIVTFYKAGAYAFTVTIEDPNSGLTTTSSVNVTVNQTLNGVTVLPSTASLNDNGTQQFTASTVDQFGNSMTSQPTFTWIVNSGGAGGTINSSGLYTAPASGTGSDTVKATSASISGTASVAVTLPSSTVELNLSSSDTRVGIVGDGTTFTGGGLDAGGYALSGNLLGTSQTWNGSTFAIGATTAANNVNNVLVGAGQTIAVSQNRYTMLKLLATHTNGSASLTFTINYTDGTTQSLTQSYSDWYSPQNFTGESQAIQMAYRDSANGSKDSRTFFVYGYAFALNNPKTVASITLPSDGQFEILAMDLVGVPAPTVTTTAAASPSPVTGTTANLTVLGTDPAGDAGPTYTWAATNTPGGAIAPTFSVNGTTAANSSTVTFHQAGAYTFTVTIEDPTSGLSSTSSVNVTVNQTLTKITITPAGPVALADGQSQQFQALAIDQFNDNLLPQPAITWTVASGVGSISTGGLYQAPATGTATATVQAAVGSISSQATVQVGLPAWLGSGSIATWNSSSKILTVTGAASIIADPGTDEPIIQANTSSGVITINPATGTVIHIGGLSLTNGATAAVTATSASRLLMVGIAGATSAPTFTIDSTSQLNLASNDMDIVSGSLSATTAQVARKYSFGAWNGSGGIYSSTASADSTHRSTLGVIQNNQSGTAAYSSASLFDGIAPGASDILVKYTYYGDANLNGTVDGSDYTLIDNGFSKHGSLNGWYNGDFNYDGIIDGSDYTLIDNAFNTQSTPLAQASTVTTPAAIVNPSPATTVIPSTVSKTSAGADQSVTTGREHLFDSLSIAPRGKVSDTPPGGSASRYAVVDMSIDRRGFPSASSKRTTSVDSVALDLFSNVSVNIESGA